MLVSTSTYNVTYQVYHEGTNYLITIKNNIMPNGIEEPLRYSATITLKPGGSRPLAKYQVIPTEWWVIADDPHSAKEFALTFIENGGVHATETVSSQR